MTWRALAPVVLCLAASSCSPAHAPSSARPAQAADTRYEIYALRYAVLPSFPVRGLVEGADSARRLDIAMTVWLLRDAGGRNVLVDAGFYRDSLVRRWKPRDYVSPAEALQRVGLRPEDITDVVVTHLHWDHADGVDLFPKARIWLQREEFDYYTTGAGRSGNTGVTPDDAALFMRLKEEGRLQLVDGDGQRILPGITVYTGGRHTYASQYAGVETEAGTAIIASDNLYLYENLERHAPIAQTFDREANLRAQDRMRSLAASPRLIVPGHDPEVFVRFPEPGGGVARIR
jgi:glyoxylase-like metal-dependent hydrolase (beta-lactamase superfamily II)